MTLIEYCPDSVKVEDDDEWLPIHHACIRGNVRTVECLLKLYPESFNAVGRNGYLPIHIAAIRNGEHKVEIVRLLLKHDSACASKATYHIADQDYVTGRSLPLHLSCHLSVASFYAVKLLFDAYPEAILYKDADGFTPLDILRRNKEHNQNVKQFLEAQLEYARKARDVSAMSAQDSSGRLPLHNALRDNATLGAIKLLVKGNSSALDVIDNQGMLPFHTACRYSSTDVVEYLLTLDNTSLNHCDPKNNSALHYACQGGNCEVVKLLLEMNVPSVSERNTDDKLPIQILLESEDHEVDHSSPEFVETIWLLLLAYPLVLS